MTGITYGRESFAETWEEAKPLAKRDWEEMSYYRNLCSYGIDEAAYQRMEDAGRLRVYTVRRDGDLIGYCCFVLSPGGLHAPNIPHATGIDLWVAPEERKGMTGAKLVSLAETALELDGIVVGSMSVPIGSVASQLLERMGWLPREVSHVKVLQREHGHA